MGCTPIGKWVSALKIVLGPKNDHPGYSFERAHWALVTGVGPLNLRTLRTVFIGRGDLRFGATIRLCIGIVNNGYYRAGILSLSGLNRFGCQSRERPAIESGRGLPQSKTFGSREASFNDAVNALKFDRINRIDRMEKWVGVRYETSRFVECSRIGSPSCSSCKSCRNFCLSQRSIHEN